MDGSGSDTSSTLTLNSIMSEETRAEAEESKMETSSTLTLNSIMSEDTRAEAEESKMETSLCEDVVPSSVCAVKMTSIPGAVPDQISAPVVSSVPSDVVHSTPESAVLSATPQDPVLTSVSDSMASPHEVIPAPPVISAPSSMTSHHESLATQSTPPNVTSHITIVPSPAPRGSSHPPGGATPVKTSQYFEMTTTESDTGNSTDFDKENVDARELKKEVKKVREKVKKISTITAHFILGRFLRPGFEPGTSE